MKKRIISAVLAVMMIFAMTGVISIGAMAAGPEEGVNIKVSAPGTQTLAGQDISLYKVFDAVTNGAAISYTLSNAFYSASVVAPPTGTGDFFTYMTNKIGVTYSATSTTNAQLSADLQKYLTDNPGKMQDFAAAVRTFAQTNSVPYDDKVTGTGTSVLFDSHPITAPNTALDLGGYLILGTVPVKTGAVGETSDPATWGGTVTSFAVFVTNDAATSSDCDGNLDVDLKLDVPTIDKQVWNHNDNSNAGAWDTYTDINIGDYAKFQLTSNVPNTTGYDSYTFIMHDKLSEGLTAPAPSVTVGANTTYNYTVTIGGVPLVYGDDYTVDVATDADGTSTDITITFLHFTDYTYKDAIVVTYSALLNDKAKVSGYDFDTGDSVLQANPNQVYLEYSNNPYNTGEGGDTTNTPPVIVNVYTYNLEIHKYTGTLDTGSEKPLPGTEFLLFYAAPGTAPLTIVDTTKINTKTYIPVNFTSTVTGTYTVNSLDEAAYVDALPVAPNYDAADTIISDTDGKIYISGLDAGTYYLVETKEVTGYNPLTYPVQLIINPTYTTPVIAPAIELQTPVEYKASFDSGLATDISKNILDVQNNAGAHLPITGGMGTTIFTITGIILMLGVGITLIARRRFGKKGEAELGDYNNRLAEIASNWESK